MNIYDIARESGVSIATVSRVLNGSQNVRESTRKRVLDVMKTAEYVPNAFARGLGLNTMKMAGILCTDVSDTFYARAVSLVERQLRKKGFDVLLCCTGNEFEEKKKGFGFLLQKRVDAIFLIGSPFAEENNNAHIAAAAQRVPVLLINGLVSIPGVYCVLCDEGDAMRQNIELLYEQGHRQVLYLYDTLTYSGRQKIAGYRQGMKNCGQPVDERYLVHVQKDVKSVQNAVSELIKNGLSFTAVATAEDLLAVGAQKALTKAGKSAAIIGFNNSILAQCASPTITSVDNMLDTLCPVAVRALIGLLEGKLPPQKSVVSARTVERETFRLAQTC